MHRVYQAFNPSRSGDGLNFATTYAYDGLDRTLTVTTADNAVVTTSYSGNQTTVTDQAGYTRVTTADGLGRLIHVVEDPNSLDYTTTYAYDPLDDLTGVTQASESRSFIYDSLKRLTSATNPESGTISYTYDSNGNLLTRTDARGLILCFGTLSSGSCTQPTNGTGYDAINRPLKKSYSDSTPTVTFTYDTATLGKHRLASVANSVSTTNFTSYDPFGNILASSQPTDGLQNSFSYTYNLASDLLTETYPSGRVVTSAYDQANRPLTVSGLYNSTTTPYLATSSTQYAPHGEMWQYNLGNNVWYQTEFNSRLQPCYKLETLNEYSAVDPDNMSATLCSSAPVPAPNGVSQLLALGFNWGTTADNGNLLGLSSTANSSELSAPVSVAQTYGYDNVNRLTSASETAAGGTSWSRSFGYDAYGNMWVTANTGVSLNGVTPTSNVYSNNQMSTNTYDLAGNVTALGSSNSTALQYDAENHQIQATEPPLLGGATENYYYDGNGRRVEKSGPAGTSVFAYDASGQLAYEYDTAGNPPPCTTCYLSPDHVGTPRMVTGALGNVIGWHDYLPFGEEIPSGIGGRTNLWDTNDNVNQKFTGKERDLETGLDYFLARYYASAQGRFTSPDEFKGGFDDFGGKPAFSAGPLPYADIGDPQTLNKYAYVRNNPFRYIDPDGHEDVTLVKHTFEVVDILVKDAETAAAASVGIVGNVFGAVALTLLNPQPLGGKDETEGLAYINSQSHKKPTKQERAEQADEERPTEKDAELQTSTSGAGARQRGGRPPKDLKTLPGTLTQIEGVENAREAGRAGKTSEIQGTDKSKQDLKNQLKKIETQKDAGPS